MDTKKLRQKILDLAIHGKLVPPVCRQAGKILTMNPEPPIKGKKCWFTYVIECEDGSFYKGYTDDLLRRYKQHCDGNGAEYTKKHKPKQLYYWEMHYTQENALNREKYLKSGIGREWFKREVVDKPENFEPASVLLERIRAEKERLIKEGKIKKSRTSKTSDTPHYENVPFEVPDGWGWTTLGEICSIKGGKRIPKGKAFSKEKTDHVYLRVTDMKNNTIIMSDLRYIDDDVFSEIESYTINSSDLYLTIAGTIGAVGIVPETVNGMNLTENAAKLTNISCDKMYLMYSLLSTIAQEHFSSRFHQVAQPKLSIETASKTPIPLPPIEEQERVVVEIEKWLALIETIESGKTDLQTTIKQAKSKILDLAIHGKLVPQDLNDEPASELLKRINPNAEITCDNGHYQNLPKGWALIKVGDAAVYTNGRAFKPEEWMEEGLPIIRIQNLNDKTAAYNFSTQSFESKYLIKKGDLLFAWAASLGAYIWEGKNAWLNQHIFKVLPYPFVMKEYLYYIFKAMISEFYSQSHGSGMVHITKKQFENMTLMLPPYPEQKRIINKIEELLYKLDAIMESL